MSIKLIQAIIRKERLGEVLTKLFEADIRGITTSKVQGHGGEKEKVETYRGTRVKMELSEKVKLEIAVTEPFVEKAVKAIIESARTGEVGDGKVFIIPVEKAYRIRTGEQDDAAVTPIS